MATHLIQKPGESTWYVRMAVPEDVRQAFGGRAKLIKTTGTSNKSEAMDRRLPILAQWKADINAAREQKLIARELWRPELAEKGLTLSQSVDMNLLKAIKNPPKGSGATAEDVYARVAKLQQEQEALLREVHQLESLGATGIVERIRATFVSPPANMVDGVQTAASITQDVTVQLAEHRYGLSADELAEARDIVQSPTTYKPVSPITDRRLETFRAYRIKMEVAAKTIDQQESKLKDLSAYLKTEGKRLDKEVVAAWLEKKTLSAKTKAQYLLAGSTFWQWAIAQDAQWKSDFGGIENPFSNHRLPKRRVAELAQTARKAFTPDELESVFAAAKNTSQSKLCDLIMLGTYTGMRIEEIAQLTTASVVIIEGVRSFKLDDAKTLAGVREVPVHPTLSPLVDRLIETSKDGFLLPSSAGNKYGIRSDPLSKAFGRLKTSLGFGRQHVFHSVRATVITQLLRSGIPGNVVANIVGHETGIVTFDVYDEGASPHQKLAALEKLPLVFS